MGRIALLAVLLTAGLRAAAVTVAADGSGQFRTVQEALDWGAADIGIRPGTYREHLTIARRGVHLRGLGATPQEVVLTFDLSAGTAGGTTNSASITVSGDDFYAGNLTIENSFSRTRPLTEQGSQAVALKVTGDRAVFRRVRFLGYQDTLYANTGRQYFVDCYIEGNVDFIFGDALAYFENCEIHALAHSVVYLTAQSKRSEDQRSGYVFAHCRITADPGAKRLYLGRPWRRFGTVVFLNTVMPAEIAAEGWHEWEHDGKPSLPTAFYAERGSTGPGANPARRQLTAAEAARFERKTFLAGEDGWDPTEVH